MKRTYAWSPDVPDQRDRLYAKRLTREAIVLPSKTDLREWCSPVENQGRLGSCTSNAIVGALEFLQNFSNRKTGAHVDLSRLFLYYNERVVEGTVNTDAGAIIRTGVKSALKLGVCTEKLWPYRVTKFKTKPVAAAFMDGLTRRATSYERIESLPQLKHALARDRPVVFGISVYASFESAEVAATGTVPMPKKGEVCLGGHAVLAVGYDDRTKSVLCRNSWGADWGNGGYFTLPYAYVSSRSLSDDLWCILS
jgi:C1A family cysteine protease